MGCKGGGSGGAAAWATFGVAWWLVVTDYTLSSLADGARLPRAFRRASKMKMYSVSATIAMTSLDDMPQWHIIIRGLPRGGLSHEPRETKLYQRDPN